MAKQIYISCIGDSLTAGLSGLYGDLNPNTYQYWIVDFFKENHLEDISKKFVFKNLGMPGAVMSQIKRQLEHVEKSDFLIIMGGTNDVWMFSSASDQEQNQECIEHVLKTHESIIQELIENKDKYGENINVILCSIPPIKVGEVAPLQMHENILKINSLIQTGTLSKEKEIHFADVHKEMCNLISKQMADLNCQEDGVHFTPEGNKACGYAIAKVIKKKKF